MPWTDLVKLACGTFQNGKWSQKGKLLECKPDFGESPQLEATVVTIKVTKNKQSLDLFPRRHLALEFTQNIRLRFGDAFQKLSNELIFWALRQTLPTASMTWKVNFAKWET